MGQQRVREMTVEAAGGDVLASGSNARRYVRPCPLSVLGVECSSVAIMPSAPAEAFGDMASAFPSADAIREAGGYAMALALADQPVPSALCCDRTVVATPSVTWF